MPTRQTGCCASLDTEFNIAARAGARLGSDFLVYGKIGYTNLGSEIAYTDLNGVLPSVAEGNDADGILFGAGLEFNLGNGPYAKLEYRYADYENRGESSNGNIIDFGITRSQVMAGLGWRF